MELIVERDKKRLEELEGVIEKNLKSFFEVGKSLLEIQRNKLYLHKNGGEYQTFEAYCRETWEFQRTHAYHLIASVEVVDDVSSKDDIQKPVNQRQTRPLEKLSAEQRCIIWAKAVETAPEGKVTAAHVAKVVKEFTKESRKEGKEEDKEERDDKEGMGEEDSGTIVRFNSEKRVSHSTFPIYSGYNIFAHSGQIV